MIVLGPGSNLAMKVAICCVLGGAVVVVILIWAIPRIDYNTRIGLVQPQPVPFSHKHHAVGLGIDCRYCHTSVEVSASAGIPPIETCMTCHSQIWTNAELLAPIRAAFANGAPIHWRRVNTLPDYVYFNLSIHIAKGVGCTTCHGPIGSMPLTWKGESLFMSWCLDCHRDPGPRLRPLDAVFDPLWRRGPETLSGDALVKANHVVTAGLTDCSTCHR
ncbi:MAG: cytochrome c3 family protein [Alphaproteobacteria bacterium]|nr:cytochrome c3 family protein [Alphaproteobacteria bacterium]